MALTPIQSIYNITAATVVLTIGATSLRLEGGLGESGITIAPTDKDWFKKTHGADGSAYWYLDQDRTWSIKLSLLPQAEFHSLLQFAFEQQVVTAYPSPLVSLSVNGTMFGERLGFTSGVVTGLPELNRSSKPSEQTWDLQFALSQIKFPDSSLSGAINLFKIGYLANNLFNN